MRISFFIKFLFISILVIFLLLLLFYFWIYPKISFYQPVKIKIETNLPLYANNISMHATTPFNRTIQVPFDSASKSFHVDYSFLKEIYVALPAQLINNDFIIRLIIGQKEYVSPSDKLGDAWKTVYSSSNYTVFRLIKPDKQKSFFLSLSSLLFWPILKPFYLPGIVLLIFIILGVLLSHYKKKILLAYSHLTKRQKILYVLVFFYSISLLIFSVREFSLLREGLEHINLFSSLWFYLFSFTLIGLLLHFVFMLLKLKPSLRNKILLSCSTLFVLLFCIEIGLRIAGLNANYFELKDGKYGLSNYDSRNAKPLFRRAPNSTIHFTTSEFEYYRTTNSLGFCDDEFQIQKNGTVKRMIVLGDSYSEGVGVDADSCWISLLRKALSDDSIKWEVYNAGVIGSDPVYQFYALENELLVYSPDIVIVPVNNSDVSDIIFRGGFERFQPDGKVLYKKGPWWEPLYAYSYFLRLIINNGLGCDYHLLSRNEQINEYKNALIIIEDVCQRFVTLAEKHNIQIIFLFHPLMKEVELNHYFILNKLINKMGKNETLIDVLPYFIIASQNQKNTELFWPLDKHYKVSGHKIVAKKILDVLKTNKNAHSIWH